MGLGIDDASKFLFKTRKFLNKDEETMSAIRSSIEVSTWRKELKDKGLYDNCYIDFSMSDCNRIITLDFGVDSEEEFDNSMHKIDIILSTFFELKASMIEARVIFIEGNKELEEIDKKSKE